MVHRQEEQVFFLLQPEQPGAQQRVSAGQLQGPADGFQRRVQQAGAFLRQSNANQLGNSLKKYGKIGVAPVIVEQMAHMILELKASGVSILLSEQNMHFAELVSDRAYVLEKGQIRFSGTMAQLADDEEPAAESAEGQGDDELLHGRATSAEGTPG